MVERGYTIDEVAKRAGVSRESIYRLRNGSHMGLTSFHAILNAIGLKLKIEDEDDGKIQR